MGTVTPLKIAANLPTQCQSGDQIDPSLTTPTVNAQTGTAYTLALTDNGAVVTMNNASANTVTIPANATIALPVGATLAVVQLGAGATTVTGASGVTVNGTSAGTVAASAQYGAVGLVQVAADTWIAQVGQP